MTIEQYRSNPDDTARTTRETTMKTTQKERMERLAAIFGSVATDTTFTEQQTETRGTVRPDEEVDAAITAVIREMRDRYGFDTPVTDDDLVTLVRGFYGDASDGDIARDLGTDRDTVAWARLALHLFRPTDLQVSVDPDRLRELIDEDADDERIARTLGTDTATVRRSRALLDARRAARQVSYRYPMEFAAILDVTEDSTLADAFLTDRRLMDLVSQ